MKTIPIITFFLCTVMYAHAQLNIVPKNDGLKEYTCLLYTSDAADEL